MFFNYNMSRGKHTYNKIYETKIRYLEQLLREHSFTRKAVAIAAISAGIILMSGCNHTSSSSENNISDELLEVVIDTVESVKEAEIKCDEISAREIPPPEEATEKYAVSKDSIYTAPDHLPEFPGGEAELQKFIRRNLRWPEDLSEICLQGRVQVKFYVDTLGKIHEPQIVKTLYPSCDEEALRIASLLPDFIPAEHQGKKVKAWYIVKVTFRIEGI